MPTTHTSVGDLQSVIFNSANFSSIATDANGVIQIFNVGAERLLGYTAADVVNTMTPADMSDSQELIARARGLSLEFATPIAPGFEALAFKASRGIEDIYELTYVRKDGSRFPAVVSVSALRDGHGAIIGYLLIGADNTTRQQVAQDRKKKKKNGKKKDKKRKKHNVELKDAGRMTSEFFANMSHDLRAPLSHIIGFSWAFRDGLMGEMTDEQRGAIGNIFSSGQHLLSLINGVLDSSDVELRAASGANEDLARAPATVRADVLPGPRVALVVENDVRSAELIRVQLQAEGFTVLHAASAEDALALAGRQPLSLMTLDVMLPGMDGWEFLGCIRQVPSLRRVPVVITSLVADRNRGFALGGAAVLQKPISRRDLCDSLRELGLFPLAEGRTLTVLVVDDDPNGVELIAVRMRGLASTVLRAHGGREAIDAAHRELPDLIVLDLMMPDVNGFDVVEALKDHPDTARIPVLVVTARRITTEDRATLNGYVLTIMEKTEFDRDRFTAEVRRAMSLRRAAV